MSGRLTVLMLAALLFDGASAAAQTERQTAPTAQPPFTDPVNGLSLDEAMARALEREPTLRAERSQLMVARGERVQAGLRPNPSVSFEQREEPSGTDRLTTVSVEWPLDLFRLAARTRVADREVTATGLAIADRERRLAADVRAKYGEVLVVIRELQVLEDLLAATRGQLEVLSARVEEGASPPLERDLLRVEQGRLEADRMLLLGRAEAALLALKRLLGLNVSAPLTVRDTLEQIVRTDAPSAVVDDAGAAQRRPDVREAAARVDVAEASVTRAERDGAVDISLYGSYMRMDSGFPQLGVGPGGDLERVRGRFHYLAGGLRATLPVGNRNQGAVAAARAAHSGTVTTLEAARLAAEIEIASARAQDQRARAAVALYRTSVREQARLNLSVVTQSYDLGRVTLFDVLAERRRHLEIERAYTDAMRAAYEAGTAVMLATGAGR